MTISHNKQTLSQYSLSFFQAAKNFSDLLLLESSIAEDFENLASVNFVSFSDKDWILFVCEPRSLAEKLGCFWVIVETGWFQKFLRQRLFPLTTAYDCLMGKLWMG